MNVAVSRTWKIWVMGVIGLVTLAVVLVLGAAQFARHELAKKYPPPGKIISLADGRGLHVVCEGRGATTVLLEAGLNEFSIHWNLLQTLLARDTRACAYDRAGFGWSDLSDRAPTIDNSVRDLEELVGKIADKQPLILVGHSYGSFLVRLYAQRNPQYVKAVILLDPASERMAERIDGYAAAINNAISQFDGLKPVSSLGFMALAKEEIPAGYLSGMALERYRASLASAHFFEAASAETGEMLNNIRKMQDVAQDRLAAIPVVVISRGKPDPIPGLPEAGAQNLEKTWADLQLDLVKRLRAKHLVAPDSGHSVNQQQPEFVYKVIRAHIETRKDGR